MTACKRCGLLHDTDQQHCPDCLAKMRKWSNCKHVPLPMPRAGKMTPRDFTPFADGFKVRPGHAPGWWEIQ